MLMISSLIFGAALSGCLDSVLDDDDDGVKNDVDNCVSVSNPDQLDTDQDSLGDECDDDDDGDGSVDSDDAFPKDATEQIDSDGDGTGNNADSDDDDDGWGDGTESECVTDPLDADSVPDDADSDGTCDTVDSDDDGDGTLDTSDAFPLDPDESSDIDGDGVGDNTDDDDDDDGTLDTSDAFPTDPNEDTDTDGDGTGDNADTDDDNDGVMDYVDPCPNSSFDSSDLDYDLDGCYNNEDEDDDNDGVTDDSDNCPLGWRTWTQDSSTDHDLDGCHDTFEDTDDDNDGTLDVYDQCPVGYPNWDSLSWYEDFDSDGCKDMGGCPDYCDEDLDDDNDGILDPNDFFDYGNGVYTIVITQWDADPNDCDYDTSCGSPDVEFRIAYDLDCDYADSDNDGVEDWDIEVNSTALYDVRSLGDGMTTNLLSLSVDIPDDATSFCYKITVLDLDSGWLSDYYEGLNWWSFDGVGYSSGIFEINLNPHTDSNVTYSTIGDGEDYQCGITVRNVITDDYGYFYHRIYQTYYDASDVYSS